MAHRAFGTLNEIIHAESLKFCLTHRKQTIKIIHVNDKEEQDGEGEEKVDKEKRREEGEESTGSGGENK